MRIWYEGILDDGMETTPMPAQSDVDRVIAFLKSGEITIRYIHIETCNFNPTKDMVIPGILCGESWGAGMMHHEQFEYSIGCWHYIGMHGFWNKGMDSVLEHINSIEETIGPVDFNYDFEDPPVINVPNAEWSKAELIKGWALQRENLVGFDYYLSKDNVPPDHNGMVIGNVDMIRLECEGKVTYALPIEVAESAIERDRKILEGALVKLTEEEKRVLGL